MQEDQSETPFTVYVVDDDAAIRRALTISLSHEGYAVVTYSSAEAFLDEFDPDIYGCIILDMRMPGIEGLELQERLASSGTDLPIIFVTGHASVPLSVQAIKRGAVDFLEKPFRRQVLLDRIGEARHELDTVRSQRSLRVDLHRKIQLLTKRERQIFDLLVDEEPKISSKEIASALSISPRTAEQHRSSVLSKLGADSIAQLGMMLARAEYAWSEAAD